MGAVDIFNQALSAKKGLQAALAPKLGNLSGFSYRLITNDEDFADLRALRRQAYLSTDAFAVPIDKLIVDDFDYAPNTKNFGIYHFGKLVAALRITVIENGALLSPSSRYFTEVWGPLSAQGMRFVDPSKFVVDRQFSKDFPVLPFLAMRIAHIATAHYQVDYCLAVTTLSHERMYRRLFKSTRLAGPKKFEAFNQDAVLVGGPRSSLADNEKRFPIYRYTDTERRMLFEKQDNGLHHLEVIPSPVLETLVA